jgi:membrane protease YdiL (CAAX protease family)
LSDHQPSAISPPPSDGPQPSHGLQPSDGHPPSDPRHQPPAVSDQPSDDRPFAGRVVALIEVLICSDVLTQFAIGGTLLGFGYPAKLPNGQLNVGYVVALSLGDAVLLVGLILLLLYAHGERPRDVLLGRRPFVVEGLLGLLLIPIAFGIAIAVMLAVRRFAPSLHNVPDNPLQGLLGSPRDAWLFALVVLVAGGVREEIQRAFLLHRFDVWLGGGTLGLVVTSVAFGAGHFELQGADAGLATGLLGALWGVVYLRRRSSIAPIVSHAAFDLLQILPFLGLSSALQMLVALEGCSCSDSGGQSVRRRVSQASAADPVRCALVCRYPQIPQMTQMGLRRLAGGEPRCCRRGRVSMSPLRPVTHARAVRYLTRPAASRPPGRRIVRRARETGVQPDLNLCNRCHLWMIVVSRAFSISM